MAGRYSLMQGDRLSKRDMDLCRVKQRLRVLFAGVLVLEAEEERDGKISLVS